jgi:hypothetical protein
MSVRGALRSAFVDFYHHSWRLFLLNAALCGFVAAVLWAGIWFTPAVVLVVLAGPLAAALMHCAVTVAQTDELELREVFSGLRLHWRRGLALVLAAGLVAVAAGFAIPFYARAGGWAWAPAMLAVYLVALFGVVQLSLWPLAVFDRERSLGELTRDALVAVVRRPAGYTALAAVLLVVNALGLAAAFVPFLTLTIAYSFLAAAHFVLPRGPIREA